MKAQQKRDVSAHTSQVFMTLLHGFLDDLQISKELLFSAKWVKNI